MKFAIFGDIHANLEALNAVLEDANENDCSHFVCIGDIVGYNANPKECLATVKRLDCPVVKGNHDEVVSSDAELIGLNPLAEQSMNRTRENLSQDDKNYLMNLKLVRQVRDFTIAHATRDSPGGWGYITSKFHALESFGYQYTPVCFIGHTHVPAFYVKTSSVEELSGRILDVESSKKYLINVGSVGQPRDGDPRASYCIYDLGGQRIVNRRVEYDIKSAQEKIIDAGLPDKLADRLSHGQ